MVVGEPCHVIKAERQISRKIMGRELEIGNYLGRRVHPLKLNGQGLGPKPELQTPYTCGNTNNKCLQKRNIRAL